MLFPFSQSPARRRGRQDSFHVPDPPALGCDAKSGWWEVCHGCVPLGSQPGCHHKTSPSLTQSFCFVCCFPLGKKRHLDIPGSQKGSASLSLSCYCDIIRVGWVTFEYGLKPRNVTERRLFVEQNRIQIFFKINSSVDSSCYVHYSHSKNRKATIFTKTCSRPLDIFAHVATGTSQNLALVLLSVRRPYFLLPGLRSDSASFAYMFMIWIQYILLPTEMLKFCPKRNNLERTMYGACITFKNIYCK